MSFHPSHVTAPLEDDQRVGMVRIAGHDFPGSGTYQEEVVALEHAMVNIYRAINTLAQQILRLDGEIAALRK